MINKIIDENMIANIIAWIRNKVKQANAQGVVIAISGGVDSAVVASLAKKAFPNNSLGVIMPINEMLGIESARELCHSLEINSLEINLSSEYEAISQYAQLTDKLAKINLAPRLRMTTLYALAQEKKYLVLGTGNAVEFLLGYFTKYGDGAADIYPIANFLKSEVYTLAKILSISSTITAKPPSADLYMNQTDEEEFGFTYDEVEQYMLNKNLDIEVKEKIESLIERNSHKTAKLPKWSPK